MDFLAVGWSGPLCESMPRPGRGGPLPRSLLQSCAEARKFDGSCCRSGCVGDREVVVELEAVTVRVVVVRSVVVDVVLPTDPARLVPRGAMRGTPAHGLGRTDVWSSSGSRDLPLRGQVGSRAQQQKPTRFTNTPRREHRTTRPHVRAPKVMRSRGHGRGGISARSTPAPRITHVRRRPHPMDEALVM